MCITSTHVFRRLLYFHLAPRPRTACIINLFFSVDATTFLYANWVFGQGSGPVQLSAVECSGNESSLLNCSHTTTHNCGHTKDIGVRCHGESKIEACDHSAKCKYQSLMNIEFQELFCVIFLFTQNHAAARAP